MSAQKIWFAAALDAQNQVVRLCEVGRAALAETPFLDERWDRTGCATRAVRLADMPEPKCGDGEVLIDVAAASVTPGDCKLRAGY